MEKDSVMLNPLPKGRGIRRKNKMKWKSEKLKEPCPKCKATDIRRVSCGPLHDIWVCYSWGQAQMTRNRLPKKLKFERNRFYHIGSNGNVWNIKDGFFEYASTIDVGE